MAYVQQVWNNGPNSGTPLNATRLNKMEAGIGAAATAADNANSATSALSTRVNAVQADVDGAARNDSPVIRLRSTSSIDFPRNTWKAATWTAVEHDRFGQFSSSNNTRFTCKLKGVYWLDAVAYINAWKDNYCYIALRKNGTELDTTWRSTLSLGPSTSVTTNGLFALDAGDYIETVAYHDATTDPAGYRRLYGAAFNAFMVKAL